MSHPVWPFVAVMTTRRNAPTGLRGAPAGRSGEHNAAPRSTPSRSYVELGKARRAPDHKRLT